MLFISSLSDFKVTVYDRSTDSTLSSAIVYISGTSRWNYSDIHGKFDLDISEYSSMPITISILGYCTLLHYLNIAAIKCMIYTFHPNE